MAGRIIKGSIGECDGGDSNNGGSVLVLRNRSAAALK